MRLAWALVLAVALVGLLSGCGLGQGQQTGFDYAGSWRGTLTDEVNGSGSVQATLQQAGHALTGTWHAVMGGDAARQDGGTWAGEVFIGQDRDLLEVTLSPAVGGECSYRVTLARTNEALTGEYAATGASPTCTNLQRGTLQLSKQQ